MSKPAAELDSEFLDELLEGDRAFAEELFDTYRESAAASLAEAEELLKAGEHGQVYRPFHTLKGASASVGLTGVKELARELELDAKAGRIARCEERMDELSEAVQCGQESLRSYLESI